MRFKAQATGRWRSAASAIMRSTIRWSRSRRSRGRGAVENTGPPRQIGRQGERERQSQRAAQAAPPHEVLLIERDRPARAEEREADRIDRDRAAQEGERDDERERENPLAGEIDSR